jgi:ABC-type antimicrobial peptide transport system permease subunit
MEQTMIPATVTLTVAAVGLLCAVGLFVGLLRWLRKKDQQAVIKQRLAELKRDC